MIIILSEQLASANWDESSIEGIEKILLSAFYGNHYLILEDPKIGEKLIDNLGNMISPNAVAILKRITSNFSTRSPIKNLANKKIVIGLDKDFYLADEFIFIHLSESCRYDYSSCILLAENIKDSIVYKKLSEIYLIHEKLSASLTIAFEERGAGGSQIADELKAICDRRTRFVISVCDGDKEWPSASASAISKECKNHVKGFPLSSHVDIKIRDIENLIPMEFIKSHGTAYCENAVNQLCDLSSVDDNFILYCDIKNGLSVTKYHEYLSKSQSKEFWKKAEKIYKRISCGHLDHSSAYCSSNNCQCVLLAPISNRLLEDFKDWLELNSVHKSYEFLKSASNLIWQLIIQEIFFWGLGEKRRFV